MYPQQKKWSRLVENLTTQLNERMFLSKTDEIVESIIKSTTNDIRSLGHLDHLEITKESIVRFVNKQEIKNIVKEYNNVGTKKSASVLQEAEFSIKRSLETHLGTEYNYNEILNELLENKDKLTRGMKNFFSALRHEDFNKE